MPNRSATVVGAGLAGCEAAFQLAQRGVMVTLVEMKPRQKTPAHKSDWFGELVCSNSLKADRPETAAGLLKAEMRLLGSLCLTVAAGCAVPAGGALAVDREAFARGLTEAVTTHPLITVRCEEQTDLPAGPCIIATGPLTSNALYDALSGALGGQTLHFYDAAAPIVTAESIDFTHAFYASRYGRGGEEDYVNCPMNRPEYEAFYEALVAAEQAPLHEAAGDLPVYEGCMPVETLARRGADTLRYGPLKPVGLRDPATGHRPWAVVQLRKEDASGSRYNLVGFQTNLKFGEQRRVFGMIPALHKAEYVRYGVMHRNTFLDSPRLLAADFSLRRRPDCFFAGQITGVEGYMESAAAGLFTGLSLFCRLAGRAAPALPPESMLGALTHYVTDASVTRFQPMGASMGLLPPLPERIKDKKQRGAALAARSLLALEGMIHANEDLFRL